jgi:hypothetical protein
VATPSIRARCAHGRRIGLNACTNLTSNDFNGPEPRTEYKLRVNGIGGRTIAYQAGLTAADLPWFLNDLLGVYFWPDVSIPQTPWSWNLISWV